MQPIPSRHLAAVLALTVVTACGPVSRASAPSGEAGDVAEQEAVYTHGRASRDGRGKFYMGREIAQTMSYHGVPWLERDDRAEEEKPDEVVAAMRLSPDDTVVDLGAGSGYFTFRLAAQVPEGKVLAVDIQPEMLRILETKRQERGIRNVETVLGSAEDPGLPPGAVDAVLMVDAYHELSHPREIMEAVLKALVHGGRVVLVEYRGEDPEIAIKPLHKMTEAQVRKEMEAVGLEWVETLAFLPVQHFLVFRKPGQEGAAEGSTDG